MHADCAAVEGRGIARCRLCLALRRAQWLLVGVARGEKVGGRAASRSSLWIGVRGQRVLVRLSLSALFGLS